MFSLSFSCNYKSTQRAYIHQIVHFPFLPKKEFFFKKKILEADGNREQDVNICSLYYYQNLEKKYLNLLSYFPLDK